MGWTRTTSSASVLTKALAFATALSFIVGAASAAPQISGSGSLDGLQEVPPSGSAGTGFATITIDCAALTYTVSGSYTGLTGSATAGHIHGPAAVGSNAPIVKFLTVSGGTSGTLTGSGGITLGEIATMLDGLWYFNVHTTTFPGGEIRGQIFPARLGTPACFCDLASSPCTNPGGAGEGCRNSTGVGAIISARGSSCIALQGTHPLVLDAVQARPSKNGLWLQGGTTAMSPFKDGILCVGNPTIRMPPTNCTDMSPFGATLPLVIDTGGSLSTDDATYGFDILAAALCKGDDIAAAVPTTRHYQFWFRDGMGPCATGSNLTNRVEIDWAP